MCVSVCYREIGGMEWWKQRIWILRDDDNGGGGGGSQKRMLQIRVNRYFTH